MPQDLRVGSRSIAVFKQLSQLTRFRSIAKLQLRCGASRFRQVKAPAFAPNAHLAEISNASLRCPSRVGVGRNRDCPRVRAGAGERAQPEQERETARQPKPP